MLSRWQGGVAAIIVTLAAVTLIVLDVTDGPMRRWWTGHALTTDMVSGLLVLLITVLVIDQVVRLRQINDRSRAVAAQAAIVVNQAIRSSQALSQVAAGSGDRDAASDEFRTYMLMLLVSAPVLIDAKVSRNFLEQAQVLGGQMAAALGATAAARGSRGAGVARGSRDPAGASPARIDDAVQQLKAASAPLLQVLDPRTRSAVGADQPEPS